NVTITVTNSVFEGNKSSAFLTSGDNSAKQTINLSTSTFRDNNVGVDLAHGGSGDFVFNISNNPTFLRHANDAIRAGTADTATNAMQVVGTILNNTIGDGLPGTADSGSRDSQGIDIDIRGDADSIVSITGNTVSHTDIEGIRVQGRLDDQDGPDAEKGRLDLTLRNNVVNTPDDNSAFPFGNLHGVLIEARNTFTVCMDIANNDSSSVGTFEHFRVRQRDSSVFLLERLSDGDGTPNEVLNNVATVESHIAGQNVAGSSADATLVSGFTEAVSGTCRKP
ncbi:MAG TPA: hypothetical protein VE685_02675, partial [Thermoanaerobaculia bacterium]|nr:hypothetical protein [Thermoanaerobaculia bacterium]